MILPHTYVSHLPARLLVEMPAEQLQTEMQDTATTHKIVSVS